MLYLLTHEWEQTIPKSRRAPLGGNLHPELEPSALCPFLPLPLRCAEMSHGQAERPHV